MGAFLAGGGGEGLGVGREGRVGVGVDVFWTVRGGEDLGVGREGQGGAAVVCLEFTGRS